MAAHFINVGQGSAALFEFSCGLVLVDTGGQSQSDTDWRARFASYLDQVFARRGDRERKIDVVYITHPHPDHTLGIATLLDESRVRIGHVVVDAEDTGAGIAQQRRLVNFANQRSIPVVKVRTGAITGQQGLWSRYLDPLRCSGSAPDIRVLWGSYNGRGSWSAKEAGNENNHSVAVRIAFGESSFFITGDMEEIAIRALIAKYGRNPGVLNTDVYVAGHHGSRNGTTAEFVRLMSPEIAVISAGDPSDREPGFAAFGFGHPNKQTIEFLSDPAFGVSFRRPRVRVAVGVRGRAPNGSSPAVFEERNIDHAIFSTGWDGDVVVIASSTGEKRVMID